MAIMTKYISKVALVGAGGNSGKFMVESLLATGKHNITAITREDSTTPLPAGISVAKVNYDNVDSLVDALKGHDALVITLGGFAPKDTEKKLIDAAGEAGVQWILPNVWCPDTANEGLVKDVFPFQSKPATRKYIAEVGKSSSISISTGFWYEWSLGIAPAFGFDFAKRAVTFYDDGETKISISTWPQVGRTVAALLSLPIEAAGDNKPSLSDFKDKYLYVKSFTISQKDMFASALRVTGTTEADWTITNEASHERYATGLEQIQKGERVGFAKMMYTRVFFPDGCGNTEHNKGTVNAVLGLPEEDLDEATARAIERSKTPVF